ncbi:hypothetical protein WA026_003195 [Henosepilachna vigintioctopunctata]|uniref:Golgi apparatus protein 1 n=1 Tax=Henosepilachna vigintioctopunctata TaxID=420089 RepID=A0AAW1TIL7_9CUCU
MLCSHHFIILCSLALLLVVEILGQHVENILDSCSQVKKYCDSNNVNSDITRDMEVLECLQNFSQEQLVHLNGKCQHTIWQHTKELSTNENVYKILEQPCKRDLPRLKCNMKDIFYLRCIVENKDNINEDICVKIVDRLENVVFQDFRLIPNFLQECGQDINKLQCGRIDYYSLSQAQTAVCLQMKIQNISSSCKKELLSLIEIQANNIKLDRQLYLACKEDHLKFCSQFIAGGGRVFKCLMQQDQSSLSALCVSNLFRRQKLIAQDYKVSKGLMRACREDIKRSHCRKQTSNDKNIRLAQILLCLEGISKNGSILPLDPLCQKEMRDHRKMLMEDYRLSPEIMNDCKIDIKAFCPVVEAGGKTIHCLMENARLSKHPKRKITDVCMRALETLIKETDAGEDWRVDPVLYQACHPFVQSLCTNIKGGDARVMSCLMDNIGHEHMLGECEDALMQIQYFVARDFKLDPQLYKACKKHAVEMCHASDSWADENNPSFNNQVLPCLYRNAYVEENKNLQKNCLQEIKRVMRQRAQSVDLHPEIEEPCLEDLAEFCYDKTKKGEEMICLQKNLDNLSQDCKQSVEQFTEVEGRNVELNPYIMAHCRLEMKQLCGYVLGKDEGNVMECLISHKNDPVIRENPACRASIEHFQIISLKNYKFTFKFKMACKKHGMRFCGSAKSMNDMITCLSERITNDTIKGEKSVIPKECRQQLKAQIFQQRENIDYDPKLKAACKEDIQKYCYQIEHGNAQVLECLQSVYQRLSDKCEREVFKLKKQEITDNSVDYALMTMCASSISTFCPSYDKEDVLDCLKLNKDKRGFNKKCRLIVLHRMAEQDMNYNLNPLLQENCKIDMNKYCKNIISSKHDKNHFNNTMDCLKTAFKQFRLSDKCEKEMAYILREQALDINLNPLLKAVCKKELEIICQVGEHSNIEECLKRALIAKKIPTPMCQVEVANMIEESQADIQVDPPLQEACSLDLMKFCNEVPQGNGRHLKCLKLLSPHKLSSNCREMLHKRLEMYENAAQFAPPQDLHELYYQVVASPSKRYFFLMVFMMITSIFVVGMFCGRVSRRHMLIKNK